MIGASLVGRLLARLAFLVAAAVVLAAALTCGPVLILSRVDPPTTAFMLRERLDSGRPPAYSWVAWEEISPWVALAVVAAEDQKFPRHRGFDLESISDAVEERLRGGRARGASTITQQVAKNLFLWPGRSWVRKGVEAWFTVLLELAWPKRRILEVYLNVAELGEGVYGVGAASEAFFRKPPANLTAQEAALLAAVLPSPGRMSIEAPSPYLRQRARWIRRQMEQLGGPAYLDSLD